MEKTVNVLSPLSLVVRIFCVFFVMWYATHLAFAQPVNFTLPENFTVVYEAQVVREATATNKSDMDYAMGQYKELYEHERISKSTYEQIKHALTRKKSELGETQTFNVAISRSETAKALLTRKEDSEKKVVSIYFEKEDQTFQASSKSDLNFMYKGLQIGSLSGIIPLAPSIGSVTFLRKFESTDTPGVFHAEMLHIRASKGLTYTPVTVTLDKVNPKEIKTIQRFRSVGTNLVCIEEWQFLNYVERDKVRIPSRIEYFEYEQREQQIPGKPMTRERYTLKSASAKPVAAKMFSIDTYLTGWKGPQYEKGNKFLQYDDGNTQTAFSYRPGIPIEQQAKIEQARWKKTNPEATAKNHNGAFVLLALVLGVVGWLIWQRSQRHRE